MMGKTICRQIIFWFVTTSLVAAACSTKKTMHESVDYLLGTRIAVSLDPVAGRDAPADVASLFDEIRHEGGLLDANRFDGIFASLSQAGVWQWRGQAERELIRPILTNALALSRRTAGAFDPTLGAVSQLWGFSALKPRTEPPTGAEIARARALTGCQRLRRLDERGIAVLPGTWIDLGGIAKGLLAARAAQKLKVWGYRRGILDFGGNILVLGERPSGGPWRVAIRHPREGNLWWGTVFVRDQAIVTSGDYERYFVFQGVRYHHIMDPQTGFPARESLSVTIVGPDAGIADALSTALFVLGPKRGLALLASEFPGYHALILTEDSQGALLEQLSAGFASATGWKPAVSAKSGRIE